MLFLTVLSHCTNTSWTYARLHILSWDTSTPLANIFKLMPLKHLCVHKYFQDLTIVTQFCLVHHNIYSRNFEKLKTQLHESSLEYLDQSTHHHCYVPYIGYRFDIESNKNLFSVLRFIDILQSNITILPQPFVHTSKILTLLFWQLHTLYSHYENEFKWTFFDCKNKLKT